MKIRQSIVLLTSLCALLLLCTLSSPAQTANGVAVHQSATELRDLCKQYIAFRDGIGTTQAERQQHAGSVGVCIGYVEGAADELNLAFPSLPTPLQTCVPKEATTDELIRVTLKFIDEHPKDLSASAAPVVWEAMAASYPCRAK